MSQSLTDAADAAAEEHEDSEAGWEAYSDYRAISLGVASSIDDAVDAFARLRSRHNQNAKITAKQAAMAESHILGAAIRLVPELRNGADESTVYADILTRWGMRDGAGGGVDPDGYVAQIQETRLENECPDWMLQFALDIRTGGWELGYLQAGKVKEDNTPADDPVEDVKEVFE